MDRQERIQRRARHVVRLVMALWGDEPPPSPDPPLTAAVDALAADDEAGRARQLVVQGDHLTYAQLTALLALVRTPADRGQAMVLLPPSLVRRLAQTGHLPRTRA